MLINLRAFYKFYSSDSNIRVFENANPSFCYIISLYTIVYFLVSQRVFNESKQYIFIQVFRCVFKCDCATINRHSHGS